MNISLPDDMKAFVHEQVRINGFATTSEHMGALIRERKDAIERLRALVIEGIESGDGRPADAAYFAELRARVVTTAKGHPLGLSRPHTTTSTRSLNII